MRARCVGCGEVRVLEHPETTTSATYVINPCGTCRKPRAFWTTIAPAEPAPAPIDLVAEARRIFGDDLIEPIEPIGEGGNG